YPRPNRLAHGFLPLVLNWEPMRKYADRVALGNAQKTVTLGELSRYPIPCPPRDEQVEIVSRTRAVQRRLALESTALGKLRSKKACPLDDVFSRRVRVTSLPQQESQSKDRGKR